MHGIAKNPEDTHVKPIPGAESPEGNNGLTHVRPIPGAGSPEGITGSPT